MRKWKNSLPWIMLACFLCTLAMTVYAFRYQKERYEASYSFFALPAHADKDKLALESARMLARDCRALASTEAFRASVLASAVSDGTCRVAVRGVDGTHILKVVVTGEDAKITAELANAAGQALMEQAGQKLGATSVEMIEAAAVPEKAAYPDRAKQIALTAAGSFAVFSLLGCLVGSKRQRARYGKALTGLPVVGAVPDERKLVKRQLAPGRRGKQSTLYMKASARMVESLSDIALQLYAASREADARSMVVTSAVDDGAQAAFSLLLASTLAQQRARVLLVDLAGDARGVGDLLGVRGSRDLADYLCGEAVLGEILLSTSVRGLSFIDDLHERGGLSGLLSTSAFQQFAQAVRAEFDFVILNARAAGDAADAGMAGMTADTTLLLAQDGKCDLNKLSQTAERLARVVRRLEGIVFTRVPERRL